LYLNSGFDSVLPYINCKKKKKREDQFSKRKKIMLSFYLAYQWLPLRHSGNTFLLIFSIRTFSSSNHFSSPGPFTSFGAHIGHDYLHFTLLALWLKIKSFLPCFCCFEGKKLLYYNRRPFWDSSKYFRPSPTSSKAFLQITRIFFLF
jgi:hypothetical protein